MFSSLVVVLSSLPESQRALRKAIDLARSWNASLTVVSILEVVPIYAPLAAIVDPTAPSVMREEQRRLHHALHEKAEELGRENGLVVKSTIVEGRGVETLLRFVNEEKADLLVIGVHKQDLYLARLWSSVYDLMQEARCCVLGVH